MSQSSILTRITEQRRRGIEALTESTHFREARLANYIASHPRPKRSLEAALRQPDKGFILECKKASPSKGVIRAQFDPVEIASVYQRYAAAISVLTEPDFFQGDFAYLQAVRSNVHVPVICKDFIVTPLHVYLARYYGADAILLMLSVLDDATYTALSELAHQLDMEVLTEVSTEAEMGRAAALGARIIGINHRNLHDLSIDLNRTAQLAPLAPTDAVLVAESGIVNNQQVRELAPYVDGFLVGSHLTAQRDVDQACRQLIFGQHKVCGLTSASAALQAAAAGSTYGGLIFAPQSPRYVTPEAALTITQAAPALNYVAVVTSDDIAQIRSDLVGLPLSAVQLHGQQDYPLIRQLRSELSDITELWYALNMAEVGDTLSDIVSALVAAGIDTIVLDQGHGGTGQTFDWNQLSRLSTEQRQRCMLAGGLNPDNVAQAAQLGVVGLDMNSGLESSPGVKDPVLVQQAFTQLASYYRTTQLGSSASEEIAS